MMKGTIYVLSFFLSLIYISCGQSTSSSEPLRGFINKNNHTNVTKYLNEAKWSELFPNRYGIGLKDSINHYSDFYSFNSFIKVAGIFPHFLSDGDESIQKRELAAFLANVAQETSGGWEAAPGGYYKWGLYFLEENIPGRLNSYNDTSKKDYPAIKGAFYYGRGPQQLTWNYNYGKFSEAWYGSKDSLLQHPDLLSKDPIVSLGSALWFWMTPQFPKPSCHDIITGNWIPTSKDIQNGRFPGFGAIVNVVNGGVECGSGEDLAKTKYRYQYYLYFCKYFQVSPGNNITCTTQKPFGQ